MRYLLATLAILAVTGCASSPHKPMPDDPYYAPVLPESAHSQSCQPGLFQDAYADNLYSDIKARRWGHYYGTLQEQHDSQQDGYN